MEADISDFSSICERAEKLRLSVMVKFDGERPDKPFTVVVSGAALDGDYFRKDGAKPSELLDEALRFLTERFQD